MDNLLTPSPGLLIWTLVNFLIFLLLFAKIFFKPMANALRAREEKIRNDISSAEKFKEESEKILADAQQKLDNTHKEVSALIAQGREQAEIQVRKAAEEANKIKVAKVEEAKREIEQSKQQALSELRKEVADLVVKATEKILEEKLDDAQHRKLINSYIEKLPNN